MAGIYIHIPFCKQSCYYCDFYFSTSQRLRGPFIQALLRETAETPGYLGGETVHTVYFGGGTPSLLKRPELENILEALHRNFSVAGDAEITLEANPDDLTANKLDEFRLAGVNRLSIGVQSFFDEDLKWMNRAHNASEAMSCLKNAQDAGFSNITMDLIYGIPGMTTERWHENLERFLSLGIPHLSAYSLTVEKSTPLDKLIRQGIYKTTDDELAVAHLQLLMNRMEAAGFLQYEISNFARDASFVSKHNSAYWKNEKYLGLGPSAHSYNGESRRWNVAQLQKYCDQLALGLVPYEEEVLSKQQMYNEYLLTRLRTVWGIHVAEIQERFGVSFADVFLSGIKPHIHAGHVAERDGIYVLTKAGKFFADRIAADLFD